VDSLVLMVNLDILGGLDGVDGPDGLG